MILCARSTSRSREQNTKCRSRSENVRKVCLSYSQNNKIVWLSNVANTFLAKFTRCAKVCGLIFSWLCFRDADWLSRQTPITWWISKAKFFLTERGFKISISLPKHSLYETNFPRFLICVFRCFSSLTNSQWCSIYGEQQRRPPNVPCDVPASSTQSASSPHCGNVSH